MAGIKITLLSDVKGFLTGTKQAEDALEDVSDSLDDVAKDAAKAGDKAGDELADGIEKGTDDAADSVERLERSFKEMADSADKGATEASGSVEKLDRSFKDLADSVKKVSKSSGDIGKNVKDGTDEAGAGLEEMSSEAQGTATEVAASFDGSAESIVGGFQEAAANMFAGFGPAGAAAGLAIAAGIGIAVGKLQEAADKANELTEEAADFALEMGKTDAAGRVAMLRDRWDEVATAIADTRKMWEVWQPRAITNAEQFADAAKVGALNVKDLFDAMNDPNPANRLTGLRGALATVQKGLDDAIDSQIGYNDGVASAVDLSAKEAGVLVAKEGTLRSVKETLQDLIAEEETQDAMLQALAAAAGLTVGQYLRQQDALDTLTPAYATNTEALDASTTALQENLEQQNAAADAARGLFDAETALAGAVADATKTLVENKESGLDPTTEAGRANRDALSSVAGAYDAMADSILEAGGTQAEANATIKAGRDEIIRLGGELGITEDQAKAYADQLGLVPTRIDTKLLLEQDKAGVADAQAKYDGLGRPIKTTVTLVPDSSQIDAELRRARTLAVTLGVSRAGAAVPI